ncbi:MAG: ferritin, partial [Candidatus Omnitrophica bacterium]|nr:ferritin [Candidatus Omnitrophota bacterium]
GAAHWLKVQHKEEVGHAMKIFDFLNDRGVRVLLQSIPQPTQDFASVREVFEETLKHEKKVTALLNALSDLAEEVDDKAAEIFLQWFITEQVEEEKSATVIVENLKIVKPDSPALLMLDKGLGKREG